jgi:FkbM family methyltransferase
MKTRALNRGIKLQLERSDFQPKFVATRNDKVILISNRHYAYLQDIVDNFEYYFNAVQPKLDGTRQIVDYSIAGQHVVMPSGIPFYFSSFAEPLETTVIYLEKGGLKEGDIVLDLGSYCGATVWAFSKAVGKKGKVYAFEPDPDNYRMLQKNIEYHNLTNVLSINKGVWSFSGNLLFQGEGNMGSGISIVQDRAANQFNIQVLSLGDFCTNYNIDRIDYIKMDIEGAEVEVLKASGDILRKYKPRLIIEPHRIASRLATDEVCEILSGYGYHTEVLAQSDLPLPLIYAEPGNEK